MEVIYFTVVLMQTTKLLKKTLDNTLPLNVGLTYLRGLEIAEL